MNTQDRGTLSQRLSFFLNPIDGRYEDLKRGSLPKNILKDLTAGLIVAMVAIPLAMGFAMASGLEPEQGIVGGAIAGLIGALFGGSKYQVYGPTAAFIPVIAQITGKYDHGFLVFISLLAGNWSYGVHRGHGSLIRIYAGRRVGYSDLYLCVPLAACPAGLQAIGLNRHIFGIVLKPSNPTAPNESE